MCDNDKKQSKPRYEERFEREAKALQRNLAKRKEQQKKREQLKQEKSNG